MKKRMPQRSLLWMFLMKIHQNTESLIPGMEVEKACSMSKTLLKNQRQKMRQVISDILPLLADP